jgi:collagen type I alpha
MIIVKSRRRVAVVAAATFTLTGAAAGTVAYAAQSRSDDVSVSGARILGGVLRISGTTKPGRSVSVVGTSLATTADEEGRFVLKTSSWRPADCKVKVSAAGKVATGLVRGCGPTGKAGKNGVNGKDGANGAAGPAGAAGAAGAVGATGASGAVGAAGATGAAGVAGPQGAKGDQGDTGATGPQGAAGPQGAKGDQGDPGATIYTAKINLNGTLASASAAGTSSMVSTNIYTVTFPAAVDTCTFAATPLNNFDLVATQVLSVTGAAVSVASTNIPTHGLTQSAFFLTAYC